MDIIKLLKKPNTAHFMLAAHNHSPFICCRTDCENISFDEDTINNPPAIIKQAIKDPHCFVFITQAKEITSNGEELSHTHSYHIIPPKHEITIAAKGRSYTWNGPETISIGEGKHALDVVDSMPILCPTERNPESTILHNGDFLVCEETGLIIGGVIEQWEDGLPVKKILTRDDLIYPEERPDEKHIELKMSQALHLTPERKENHRMGKSIAARYYAQEAERTKLKTQNAMQIKTQP